METAELQADRAKMVQGGKLVPQLTIANARKASDPFADLLLPRELPNSRLNGVLLRSFTGSSLPETERNWMVMLVKEDLRAMYEKSLMQWDETEKRKEMRHEHQRFLIASHNDFGERIAFLSYRWDVEEGKAVMYVYEVSVVEQVRGNGLGRALMLYAEDLCRKQCVGSIMLTVFAENHAAMSLYRSKLNYVIDDSSPSKHGYEGVGYEILSKRIDS